MAIGDPPLTLEPLHWGQFLLLLTTALRVLWLLPQARGRSQTMWTVFWTFLTIKVGFCDFVLEPSIGDKIHVFYLLCSTYYVTPY